MADKLVHIDDFRRTCGFFCISECSDGWGCNHSGGTGSCHTSACPIASEASYKDIVELEPALAEEYQNEQAMLEKGKWMRVSEVRGEETVIMRFVAYEKFDTTVYEVSKMLENLQKDLNRSSLRTSEKRQLNEIFPGLLQLTTKLDLLGIDLLRTYLSTDDSIVKFTRNVIEGILYESGEVRRLTKGDVCLLNSKTAQKYVLEKKAQILVSDWSCKGETLVIAKNIKNSCLRLKVQYVELISFLNSSTLSRLEQDVIFPKVKTITHSLDNLKDSMHKLLADNMKGRQFIS